MGDPPLYDEKTQAKILAWKPDPWWLPDRTDLEHIIKFIPCTEATSYYDYWGQEMRKHKYFSTTAAAIDFFGRTSQRDRMDIRRLTIPEKYQGIAMPRLHAQGLIQFCQENPKLLVERRVDIWLSSLVSCYFRRSEFTHWDLNLFMTWIYEARFLHGKRMPANSFRLILHSPSKNASQQLHGVVVAAAKQQDAAKEAAKRQGEDLVLWWGLCDDFPQIIKEVLGGEVSIRVDAETSEVWDIE
jgi:hypothetical protein